MCEDGIEKSISRNHSITVCHHSQSLVIPISDPQDIYFYTILSLIIDSYNINWIWIGLRESQRENVHISNLLQPKIVINFLSISLYMCWKFSKE